MPLYLVEHDVKRRELGVFKVAGMEFERDVIVLRRAQSALAPAAEAFLGFLTEFIKRKPKPKETNS